MGLVSRLIIGEPGSGKSEAIKREIVELAETGEYAIIVMDRHGKLTQELLVEMEDRGLGSRVLYDELSNFDRVLPSLNLEPSTHPNKYARDSINKSRILLLLDIMWSASQRDGDILDSRMTYRYANLAARVHMFQRVPKPFAHFAYLFQLRHPICAQYMEDCTDQEAKDEWKQLIGLARRNSENLLETKIGGAARLAQSVFDFAAFFLRCHGGFSRKEAIRKKQVIFMDGQSKGGTVPKQVATAVYRMTNLGISQDLEQLFAETGKPHPTVVVWEEAAATRSCGLYEADMCRELRKCGFSGWIVSQDFSFGEPELVASLKNCTPHHRYFRIGDIDAAIEAGKDIGYCQLDPYLIHSEEISIQQLHAGFRPEKRKSVTHGKHGETITESESAQAEYKTIEKKHTKYVELDAQLKMKTNEIVTMQEGFHHDKLKGKATPKPVYSPMLPDPYPEKFFPGLREKVLLAGMRKSQARPEFITPVDYEICETTTPSQNNVTTRPSKSLPRPRIQRDKR